MYKIEQLSENAKASIIRYGVPMQVFPALACTLEELENMVVESGSVTYSVYEKELVTKSAPPTTPAPAVKAIVQPKPAK